MAEPSGVHCGLCSPRLSDGGELVSWCALSLPLPGAGTIHRCVAAPSAVALVTAKRICLPSGESCGFVSDFKWRRSSLIGKWGAFCCISGGLEGVCADARFGAAAVTRDTRERTAHLRRSMGSAYIGMS